MQVTKTITFAYGHRLSSYDGKCKMLHGHNATLAVTIEREHLDDTGFVLDFSDLKKELMKIDAIFDHKLILNDKDELNHKIAENLPEDWIVWFRNNPTAENIAIFIGDLLESEIVCDKLIIKLWETPTSYVEHVVHKKI